MSPGAEGPGLSKPPDEPAGDQFHYIKEALKWQYNIIGLAAAGAFALVSGSGLPLVLAAGLEMIYLATVPQSDPFRRLVRSWKYAEEKKRHEQRLRQLLRELPPELQKKYADLDAICRDIRQNYARLSSTSQIFVGQTDASLQGLLQAYMRLMNANFQHVQYMRTTNVQEIQSEVGQLEARLEKDTPKVQEINRKRIEILQKRLEKYAKIRENRQIIDAQCAALEDVVELTRDQSVTITDPQQISGQLETLMQNVESTEETVRQVEAIYELSATDPTDIATPLSLFTPPDGGDGGSGSKQRTRSR